MTHQVKLAIDQEAEIVYWLVPQPATGYISLVYLGFGPIVCDCIWWIFWLTFMDKPAWYAKCFSFLTLGHFLGYQLHLKSQSWAKLYQNHFQTIQSSSQKSLPKKTSANLQLKSHVPELPLQIFVGFTPLMVLLFFWTPWKGESLTTDRSLPRYLDVSGWDSSKAKFEPCDVGEVAGHYAYGSWFLGSPVFENTTKTGDGGWQLQYFWMEFSPPKIGEDETILTSIFFKGVETTN